MFSIRLSILILFLCSIAHSQQRKYFYNISQLDKNVSDFRTAMQYCMFGVPWDTGNVTFCEIIFPSSSFVTFSQDTIVSGLTSMNTFHPIDIRINGAGAVLDGNHSMRLLSTSPNISISNGYNGSIFSSSISLSIFNATLQNFGDGDTLGGCLSFSGLSKVVIDSVSFLGNIGWYGGAIYIENCEYVDIHNATFASNNAVNGGALAAFKTEILRMTSTTFFNNSASNIGGAIVFDNIGAIDLDQLRCIKNSVVSFGGCVALTNTTQLSIRSSNFTQNRADYGSGIVLSEVKYSNVSSNSFIHNHAETAGCVFWYFGLSHSKLQHNFDDLFNNVYINNTASSYGANIATDTFQLISYPTQLVQMDYVNIESLHVRLTLVDYFNQPVLNEKSAYISVGIRSLAQVSCSYNDVNAAIVGTRTVLGRNGTAQFTNLGTQCLPGGHMNITFSTQIMDALEFPVFEPTAANVLLPKDVSLMKRIAIDVPVSFRKCGQGEKYDLFTATKSTCTFCEGGYSFVDNLENKVTECTACPVAAAYCQSFSIYLFEDTFRWNEYATSIIDCPLVKACKGGNMTGVHSCYKGYGGPACGVCSADYYLSDTSNACLPCKALIDPSQRLLIAGIAASCFGLFLVLVFSARKGTINALRTKGIQGYLKDLKPSYQNQNVHYEGRKRKAAALWVSRLKIFISAMQMVLLGPYVLRMNFGPKFTQFMTSICALTLDFVKLFPIACRMEFNFRRKLMTTALSPIIIMGLMMIWFVICAAYFQIFVRNPDKRRDKRNLLGIKLISISLLVFGLVLPTYTFNIFKTFVCQNYDPAHEDLTGQNQILLRADLSMSCQSSEYSFTRLFAIAMVVVYPVGCPVMCFALLYAHRHEIKARAALDKIKSAIFIKYRGKQPIHITNPRFVLALDFLYLPYKSEYWYWEVVEMMRKLFFSAFLSVFYSGTLLQLTGAIFMAIIAVNMLNRVQPYESAEENFLAELGQYQLFCTYFAATFYREPVGLTAGMTHLVDMGLVFINSLVFIFIVLYAASDYRHAMKTKIELDTEAMEEQFQEQMTQRQEKPLRAGKKSVWKANLSFVTAEDMARLTDYLHAMTDTDVFNLQRAVYDNISLEKRKALPGIVSYYCTVRQSRRRGVTIADGVSILDFNNSTTTQSELIINNHNNNNNDDSSNCTASNTNNNNNNNNNDNSDSDSQVNSFTRGLRNSSIQSHGLKARISLQIDSSSDGTSDYSSHNSLVELDHEDTDDNADMNDENVAIRVRDSHAHVEDADAESDANDSHEDSNISQNDETESQVLQFLSKNITGMDSDVEPTPNDLVTACQQFASTFADTGSVNIFMDDDDDDDDDNHNSNRNVKIRVMSGAKAAAGHVTDQIVLDHSGRPSTALRESEALTSAMRINSSNGGRSPPISPPANNRQPQQQLSGVASAGNNRSQPHTPLPPAPRPDDTPVIRTISRDVRASHRYSRTDVSGQPPAPTADLSSPPVPTPTHTALALLDELRGVERVSSSRIGPRADHDAIHHLRSTTGKRPQVIISNGTATNTPINNVGSRGLQ